MYVCGWGESNSRPQLGRLLLYHLTTPAIPTRKSLRIGSAYTTRLALKLKHLYYLMMQKGIFLTIFVTLSIILVLSSVIVFIITKSGYRPVGLSPQAETITTETDFSEGIRPIENIPIEDEVAIEPKQIIEPKPVIAQQTVQTISAIIAEPFYNTLPISLDTVNKLVLPAVVNILCGSNSPSISGATGSGVIIDPRGVILTNAHVAQYALLQSHPETPVRCIVRTGAPARNKYTVEILILPRLWVDEYAKDLHLESPSGTGEHDWALLYITGTTDGSVKPQTFPFVSFDTREGVTQTNDPVLLASYPAGFLGSINLTRNMWPVSTTVSIQKVYTFSQYIIDILSLGGNIVAQGGSSGGAVVNQWNRLVGIIVTSSVADTTQERDLRAVTLSHIDRSIRTHTGHTLLSFLQIGDFENRVQLFKEASAPTLLTLFSI